MRDSFTLTAASGEPINVTRFAPAGAHEPRGVVIVAPAMATPASFYDEFATQLAAWGLITYTFDYQGYGASAQTPLREVRADLSDWASDASLVLEWVASQTPGLPRTWIGHSLGAQLLPLTDVDLLTNAIIVAAGTGYWGNSQGAYRILAPALWYAIGPTLTRIYGYYPGKKFRILGDLPAPVMRQWTTWCKHPNYLLDLLPGARARYESFTLPLTSFSFGDDETMSPRATTHLLSFFTQAQIHDVRIDPRVEGYPKIGHMGFFRPRNQKVWQERLLPLLLT